MSTQSSGASDAPRAIVVGGSLAGLFAATQLRSVGWRAEVFERSARDLDSRGGGVVLQPDVEEAFRRAGVRVAGPLGVVARERLYLGKGGEVLERLPMRQVLTSWSALHDAMRRALPEGAYHRGAKLVGFGQDASGVAARFEDGREERGDLLVAADGGRSAVRSILLPGSEPTYAGYVGWRGLVDEADLPKEAAATLADRFVFHQEPGTHILEYLVPGDGGTDEPGRRRYNWVWYRNHDVDGLARLMTDRDGRNRETFMPPGLLAPEAEAEMRAEAERMLPPQFRALVAATREPFAQAIVDLAVPRMAFGRVALLGDAAFVPRPHTAASTAKAAADAMALADALSAAGRAGVESALAAWEPGQLRLGRALHERGRMLGDRSQFPDRFGVGRRFV